MEKEIKLDLGEASGIYDAAQNIKDIYHRLLAAITLCEDDRDTYRDLFQKLFSIRMIVEDCADSLMMELGNLLPGVDAIRRQTYSPEKIEELKKRMATFGDDWRYLEGGAA